MRLSFAFLFASGALFGQAPIYYADAIIPQMPVGCNWNASIILINLSNAPVPFTVNFWPSTPATDSNGMPVGRALPIQGSNALRSSITDTVLVNGRYTITTNEPGVAMTGCNGWAEVNSAQALGGYEVLTQRYTVNTAEDVGGIQVSQTATVSFETTIPFSSRFANAFTIPFDNVAFVQGIAIVNPSFQVSADVEITYRDSQGNMICQESRSLQPGEQQVFALSAAASSNPVCAMSGETNSYTLLQSRAGVTQFFTSNLELSGFGLGFTNLGFVSFPAQTPIGQ